MAQKKKSKKKNTNKMTRSQKIMGIVGIFIILSMVIGTLAMGLQGF